MNGIAGANGTSVTTDEPDSMRQILTHLAKLGHKKIAFVTMCSDNNSQSYSIGHIRLDTFRKEAQKMGPEPLIVQTELVIDAGDFAGANFERLDGPPTYRYEFPD